MTNELLDAALLYASIGWPVFPLWPKSKKPMTKHGCKDATTDVEQVKNWWINKPDANIAIATGNGLCVMDVDDKPDKHPVLGSDMLREWELEHGEISETTCAKSGTGGMHYYFDVGNVHISGCQSDTIFIDLRCDDNYIVAPPSIHPDTGLPYTWDISPEDMKPAKVTAIDKACIQWVYDNRMGAGKDGKTDTHIPDKKLHDGEGRNKFLFIQGRSARGKGADDDTVAAFLIALNNTKCSPPLDDDELWKTIRSVCSVPPGMSEEAKEAQKKKRESNPRFNHAKIAKELINENHACFIDGVPAVFINGRYETGWDAINRAIIEKHETASSTNRKEIREYISLVAPYVKASPPNLIAFKNGVLDVLTMEFRDFEPTDIIQNVIPHNWNPDAKCAIVDETLRKLAAGDPVIELNLSEFMGLCMYRSGELAFFPILLGRKGKNASNGKSTYIKMIRAMLGKENYTSLSFNDLGEHFMKRYIAGRLANLGDDISSKRINADALEVVKKAASGDSLFCDVKNGSAFEFESYCTFVFSANKMPNFESDDDGINRRMFPLRFNARFTRDDPDFNPKISKLLSQEDACERMIVKAVQGLRRCIENNGPTPNAESIEMLEDIKTMNNSILQWMKDVDRDADSFIGCQPTPLFENYREWCLKSGIQKPFGKPGFGKALTELFAIESHVVSIDGEKKRVYRYIEQ